MLGTWGNGVLMVELPSATLTAFGWDNEGLAPRGVRRPLWGTRSKVSGPRRERKSLFASQGPRVPGEEAQDRLTGLTATTSCWEQVQK